MLVRILLFILWFNPAWANGCRGVNYAPPNIEIELPSEKLEFRHDLSINELTEKFPPNLSGFNRTNGQTKYEISYQTTTSTKKYESKKSVCTALSKIKVVVNMNMEVFIARDYPVDSCKYKEVEEHENEHVQFNQKAYTDFIFNLRFALMGFWFSLPPVESDAGELFSEKVKNKVEEVYNKFNEEAKIGHNQIDTPENYYRIMGKCRS